MSILKTNRALLISLIIASATAEATPPSENLPKHTRSVSSIDRNWGLGASSTPEAWRITSGKPSVVVAVIDTGIDLKNESLKGGLWINANDPVNGRDDDGNGFVDDHMGWNFALNSNDITDVHGHGTHVAGIVKDMAPNVRLMILKYYDSQAPAAQNVIATAKAIEYAVKMGADIINYSGGGGQKNRAEEAAIRAAHAAGVLVVAAAGNEGSNINSSGFYPAAYELPNILSVTAIDQDSQVLKSSNFGNTSVDLAAPGKTITSALPGGLYGPMTGTSQATAFVSGAAALVLSAYPQKLPLADLIRSITSSLRNDRSLRDKTRFSGKLDTYRAVASRDANMNAFDLRDSNTNETDQGLFTVKHRNHDLQND